MARYCKLEAGKSFLRHITVEPDGTVLPSDLSKAEGWALEQIDAVLQKRWSTDLDDDSAGTPLLIQQIAEQLAACYVLRIAGAGDLDRLDAADKIEKIALRDIARIKSGDLAIKLRDDSWDVTYKGSRNREEGCTGGGLSVIC